LNPPNRSYVVSVKASGDTWEEALRSLQEATEHVEEHGIHCKQIAGGVSRSHWIHIQLDKDMDAAKYQDGLAKYIQEKKEKKDD